MSKVMLTLRLDPEQASLERVRDKLGIAPEQIDSDFGVIEVSPEQQLYAVLVEEDAANRVQGDEDVSGPYSNPRIEPFGPPED